MDSNGCSIDQLCPCATAVNHGQYVSCVSQTTQSFYQAGLITKAQKKAIKQAAAQSPCGNP